MTNYIQLGFTLEMHTVDSIKLVRNVIQQNKFTNSKQLKSLFHRTGVRLAQVLCDVKHNKKSCGPCKNVVAHCDDGKTKDQLDEMYSDLCDPCSVNAGKRYSRNTNSLCQQVFDDEETEAQSALDAELKIKDQQASDLSKCELKSASYKEACDKHSRAAKEGDQHDAKEKDEIRKMMAALEKRQANLVISESKTSVKRKIFEVYSKGVDRYNESTKDVFTWDPKVDRRTALTDIHQATLAFVKEVSDLEAELVSLGPESEEEEEDDAEDDAENAQEDAQEDAEED